MNQKMKPPIIRDVVPWSAAFRVIKNPIEFFKKSARIHKDIYRIDAPIRFYVISKPEHIKDVLINNRAKYTKGPAYKNFSLMLGDGLLNSEGEKWKQQRKMIQPSFNKDYIEKMNSEMLACSDQLALQLTKKEKSGCSIKHVMQEHATNVIGNILMGKVLFEEYKPKLYPLLMEQYNFVMQQNRSYFKLPLSFPTRRHQAYHHRKRSLDLLVNEIISKSKYSKSETLLTKLLETKDDDGNPMRTEDLKDEFVTLFATGFETTGSALSWIMLLLSSNQDKLKVLTSEIDGLSNFKSSSLYGAQYLNAVVKEALRLYPPIWIVARRCIEEDHINGFVISPKSHVLLSVFNAHRDERYWDDPLQFKPERFLNDESNEAYFPYGLGQRKCIGNHFAHLQMITTISKILKNFSIEDSNVELKIDPKITLQPKGNPKVYFVKR